MGIARGPNIVTDGLVVGYDTGYGVADPGVSTRFYKGRPATNTILQGATWYGDGGNQTVGNKGYTVITDENLKYNGYETVLWTPGTSRNVYFNGNSDISTSDNSTVWTFSCYMRYEDQTTAVTSSSGGSVYLYYPNSDGNAAGTITDCGGGWYRVSRTRTGTNDNIGLAGFTGFVQNKKIYLSGPMLTKTSTEAPYIGRSVTRSDTASLIDLKRTRDIDLSYMSFDSTGQPDMDGSSDYVDLGSDVEISSVANAASNGWTAEYVFNSDSASTLQHFNGCEEDVHNAGWLALYQSRLQVWDRGSHVWKMGDTVFASNTWYHVAFVQVNGTTMQFYVNGVAEGGNHVSFAWTAAKSAFFARYIGRYEYGGYSRYFNGNMPVARLYSKALTASEITQNYKAYKNRFNI